MLQLNKFRKNLQNGKKSHVKTATSSTANTSLLINGIFFLRRILTDLDEKNDNFVGQITFQTNYIDCL